MRRGPDRRSRASSTVDGSAAARGAEIADELDVRGVADHQHELVALLRRAGRVEGVARRQHLEQRRGAVREDDPADRRAVVEPEAVRLEGRDEPADPHPRADVRGEVPQVDVGRRRGRARRGAERRRRAAARARRRARCRPRAVPVVDAAPSAMSRVCRGAIANRRSVAVGYGRLTMPVTVALRPSMTAVLGMPLPARPARAMRVDPDSTSSAVQRSPLFLTFAIVPVARTSRHSTAAVGVPRRVVGEGLADPRTRTSVILSRGAPHALPTVPVSRTRVPSFSRPSASGR